MLNNKLYYFSAHNSTPAGPDNIPKHNGVIQNNVDNNSCIVEYLETLIEYHQQQLQKHKTLELINSLSQQQHSNQEKNSSTQNSSEFQNQAGLKSTFPPQNYGAMHFNYLKGPMQAADAPSPVPSQNQNYAQGQDLKLKSNNQMIDLRSNNAEMQKLAQLVSLNTGKLSPDVSPRSHFQSIYSDADSVVSSDVSEQIVGTQLLKKQVGLLGDLAPKSSAVVEEHNGQKYKTEICKLWEETGWCRFGNKCHFAHGISEVLSLTRHPKYKTKVCRNFCETGMCNYGNRCQFLHEQKPGCGTTKPGSTPFPNAPAPATPHHRLPIFQQLADTI